jgi:hypothetical protein
MTGNHHKVANVTSNLTKSQEKICGTVLKRASIETSKAMNNNLFSLRKKNHQIVSL